ncbi:MAG: alkaline phosphatase [Ignavibacteriae bacterium HGW-Ignavibacteriae-3]|nr:MAG: alkaline phosphatase [Ignavibacteriae bacterium HGW-Ignavibacteriae-3]
MKLKYLFLSLLFVFILFSSAFSQQHEKPKLVVGIVVDQMRYDYLYRFEPYFSNGGFKRLMSEGANFTFAHFNYSPTNTAPGHATIYTGTTPFFHGIIGNDYYDKKSRKMIYCVSDSSVRSVGSNDREGQMSPRNLLSTTITDQLKLATNQQSKVIAISLKNRGAVIPGGHAADGAYWYNIKTGDMISSSYYIQVLPEWVDEFNSRKLVAHYLAKGWNLSRPESDYMISSPDDSPYEKDVFKEGKTTFPHKFDHLSESEKFDLFETTPFGNNIVQEFAKAALVNEKLGKRGQTDFMAVSFSSTDHVAHDYGSLSYENQDNYIKLDSLIADLLSALDQQVGAGNYLLFLTADHAGIDTPGFLKEKGYPAGELNNKLFIDSLKSFSLRNYGNVDLIENISNKQIYFNRDRIKKNNLDIHDLEVKYADYIRDNFSAVTSIFKRDDLEKMVSHRGSSNMILNGFNPVRSGDLFFNLQPGYLPNFLSQGTTHSSVYSYDTHVPLLFYGWHIPKQRNNSLVYIVDIAATVANLLNIMEPSASIGVPLFK